MFMTVLNGKTKVQGLRKMFDRRKEKGTGILGGERLTVATDFNTNALKYMHDLRYVYSLPAMTCCI
jgi:hypothetical protein